MKMDRENYNFLDRMLQQGIITEKELQQITEENIITFKVLARLGFI